MQLEGRFRGGYATLPSRAFTVPCRCASTLDRNTEGETNLSTDGGTALVHVTPLLEKKHHQICFKAEIYDHDAMSHIVPATFAHVSATIQSLQNCCCCCC